MSRRLRRTKIVTTLGPATDRDNNLEKVIAAGANVVRMNFSHGSPEDHKMRADKVREIAAKLGRHVAILGDLQGPKIRVSTFKEGKVFLNIGDKTVLDIAALKSIGAMQHQRIALQRHDSGLIKPGPDGGLTQVLPQTSQDHGPNIGNRLHKSSPFLCSRKNTDISIAENSFDCKYIF